MPGTPTLTLDDLKHYALRRSLFRETTLGRAVERLGFVQADPIRAPARAQDLILRQRVRGYRAGDLERRYPSLAIEEDFFVNYGFVSRDLHALMHPRDRGVARTRRHRQRSDELLAFVRARRVVHPRDVDRHFAHGTVINYWGGSSSATTHLLDDMHYRGLLRIAGRDNGIRLYTARDAVTFDDEDPRQRLDRLVDAAVGLYAPVPQATLLWLIRRFRHATPQWRPRLDAALRRARTRLGQARVADVQWYWPADESPATRTRPPGTGRVRLLAPFDPVTWDRRRFELFWGWAYRFEAYTPKAKRTLGYYALPLLWGSEIVGWGNLSVQDDALLADIGFVTGAPADPAFTDALHEELDRMRVFLGAERHVVR